MSIYIAGEEACRAAPAGAASAVFWKDFLQKLEQ